ncbi:hypothetical protein Plhal304r1_c025g0085631 [Plasmopara halstedii]
METRCYKCDCSFVDVGSANVMIRSSPSQLSLILGGYVRLDSERKMKRLLCRVGADRTLITTEHKQALIIVYCL